LPTASASYTISILDTAAIASTGSPTVEFVYQNRKRSNARHLFSLKLESLFFENGLIADSIIVDRIEIWRGGHGLNNGGTLVYTVEGSKAIREGTNKYSIILSPNFGGENVIPNVTYYDVWHVIVNGIEFKTVGFNFYLHPQEFYATENDLLVRYDLGVNRKRVYRNESEEIRIKIVPRQNHSERKNYVVPISDAKIKITDFKNNQILDWIDVLYTNKELIFPTSLMKNLPLGQYFIIPKIKLENNSILVSPKMPVMLVE
jgi:hypothetical protein